jgi:glucosamine 6-phosphate synthetase-like amidotransferase/phosphosugar isomerase protein
MDFSYVRDNRIYRQFGCDSILLDGLRRLEYRGYDSAGVAIRDAMRGRLSIEECTAKLGGLNMSSRELRDVDRIVLSACGTALHVARVGPMHW